MSVDVWARIYALAVRLYPREFRERHGEEMRRVFRDQQVASEGWGRWRVGVGGVVDAAMSGVGERLSGDRRVRRNGPGGGGGMDGWMKDLKYAWRALRRSPGFTAVAVVTIALGIGANTAIFSVVRTVLLAPLPYEEPGELVVLFGELRNRGVTHFPMSPPDFRDVREQADLFSDLSAVSTAQLALTGDDGDPAQLNVGLVTPNFFDLLGVSPILGRSFVESDGLPNEPGVAPGAPGSLPVMAVLSHGFWVQRFGSDPGALGRTVLLGGVTAEIVGVLPPGFELLMPTQAALQPDVAIWTASRIDYETAPRNNVFMRPVGRLRPDASIEQLQAQVDRVTAALSAADQVKATADYHVRAEPLHQSVTAEVRPILLSLLGAVVFVLLIACANVANLLLVRASTRERELAIRAAMGGSRGRLVRQMLLESGILSGLGALAGLVLAAWGVSALVAFRPDNLPRIEEVRIDGVVLGFTLVASLAAAAIFGLAPALSSARSALAESLKERGQVAASARRKFVRNAVVMGEVALSLVLLIGAGLMVRSFVELSQVQPGFVAEGALTFNVAIPGARYPDPRERMELIDNLQRELESMPGVVRAAGAFPLPLTGQLMNGRYGPEEALADPEAFGQAAYRFVTPGYFEAMGTRVVEGRSFTRAEYADSSLVVVVDEPLAAALWPGESAVGKRFLIRAITPEPEWVEVIGVVEHQRAEGLAAPGRETVYFTDRYLGSFVQSWVVRADVEPLSLVNTVRDRLQRIDPELPLADVRPMAGYVEEAMAPTRFALTLIAVFGVVALALAVVGLYGVLSYVVRQRTAEIGVRMAFGAERLSILKLVVGQGLGLAGAGVVVGALVAIPLTGVMESFLVGVSPTDPLTFGGISLVFVIVAAVAAYLPARRASRVDPVQALRQE